MVTQMDVTTMGLGPFDLEIPQKLPKCLWEGSITLM